MTDWKDFYGYIKEEIPTRMPEPLGKNEHMTCFFNAKHVGKIVICSVCVCVKLDTSPFGISKL